MIKKLLEIIFLILLSAPLSAQAELAVCFNTERELGTQFYHYPSVSPSKAAQDPLCSVVTKASGQTAAQQQLINTTPNKYLKVLEGLAVEMSVVEQQTVDNHITAKTAEQQAFQSEANKPECKFANLDEVTADMATRRNAKQTQVNDNRNQLQSTIDALSAVNLTAIKTILTQMNTAKYNMDSELLVEEYKLSENTMRCVLARSRGGR